MVNFVLFHIIILSGGSHGNHNTIRIIGTIKIRRTRHTDKGGGIMNEYDFAQANTEVLKFYQSELEFY